MALLDLRLMPANDDDGSSEHCAPELACPASDASPDHTSQPSRAGLKRRKAAFADVLPRAGSDPFHWLKYGEKLLRDRKTLRHYYRCGSRTETGCNAKKMVDVLVTTGACNWHYRDAHNHPTPPASLGQDSHSRAAAGSRLGGSEACLAEGSQGLLPLLSAQGLTDGKASAALAAALVAAATGNNCSQVLSLECRSPTPTAGPTLGSCVAADAQLPATIPRQLRQAVAHSGASPLVQEHHFASNLAACLSLFSSDSPQTSLSQGAPAGKPWMPGASPLEVLSQGDRKLPLSPGKLRHLQGAYAPAPVGPARSDTNCRTDAHCQRSRQRKDLGNCVLGVSGTISRLSKTASLFGSGGDSLADHVSINSPVLWPTELELSRKRQADEQGGARVKRASRLGMPTLEEASAGTDPEQERGSEQEHSQGSSCDRPDLDEERDSLSGLASCCHGHGSKHCTWLSLGNTSGSCSCFM